MAPETLVVGAGAFGVAAALELRRRGHRVTLVDPGPLPHPAASSTDINKFVRMDYGADDLYTDLGAMALERWDRWNAEWPVAPYRESGLLVLAGRAMAAGSFEYDSFVRVAARGAAPERLDAPSSLDRFPAWARVAERYPDGYFNPRAGWAASGEVVAQLVRLAIAEGVAVREGAAVARLLERGSRVVGVELTGGDTIEAGATVVAAGAWTPALLPSLGDRMWTTGQPVFYLRVADPDAYRPPRFPCWAADISRTGWYGFPVNDEGLVKIANHGPGRRVHPDEPRDVTAAELERLGEFLAANLPDLAGAEIASTRLCLYCDSWDGNFYIDHVPGHPGLVVAAGDSGHGFKFTPVLGEIIADVVEGRPNAFAPRFAWREPGAVASEGARFLGKA